MPPKLDDPQASLATDLHSLVEMTRAAAERMGLPPPRRPWLPPLPDDVVLTELTAGGPEGPAVYGLEDLPARQEQRAAAFDLIHGGHLIVAGSARTGRSTALRTLAASLAHTWSPSDLHLYGLDFGNGALLPLGGLPHCGGVIVRSETDRAERFLARLADEVARRQQLLARHGYGDIAEQRAGAPADERLPYLVVLLDRWEGFVAQYPPESASELPAAVVRLVREGLGAGLRLVVAGDRSLLTDRLASLVDEKLLLRLSDRSDYRIVNLNPKTVPEEMGPGRAVRGESGTEVQIALLVPDRSGQAQAESLRRIGDDAEARWPAAARTNRPFRIDALPSTVTAEEALPLAQAARGPSPLWALVGVGGDELTAYGVDLGLEGGFVIGGPPRTGRSTAALTLARSLLAGGAELAVVCPRPSPLSQLEGTAGVLGVWGASVTADELTAGLQKASGPVAIVIDDAESFARSEGDEALKAFLKGRGPGQAAVIVSGQIEEMKNELRGCIVEAKKAKAGLLLSPGSTLDGELVGLRLPRNLVGRTPPGRGMMSLHGEATVVQVPLA
jgi:S-DNA-T family DNA segregation ATPase FtsK/SpoIIIE